MPSMFTQQEADELVASWEIIAREEQVRYLPKMASETSLLAWTELYPESEGHCSPEEWQAGYVHRANAFQYAHLYFFLRKP